FVHNASGVLVNTTSIAIPLADTPSNRYPLEVGRTLEVNSTYTTFKGMMDELRVWNVVRTQAQVEADMFNRLTGSETGLAGYWRFEEAAGQSVLDSSTNANHGWLGGAPTMQPALGPSVTGSSVHLDGVD